MEPEEKNSQRHEENKMKSTRRKNSRKPNNGGKKGETNSMENEGTKTKYSDELELGNSPQFQRGEHEAIGDSFGQEDKAGLLGKEFGLEGRNCNWADKKQKEKKQRSVEARHQWRGKNNEK